MSADKTSVVSEDKRSVVSGDRTSVVSLCQQISPKTSSPTSPPQGQPLRGRPCVENAWGMSWEMSADTMTQQMSCLQTRHNRCLVCRHISSDFAPPSFHQGLVTPTSLFVGPRPSPLKK